jgi:Rieske Fe-S protein
MTPKQSRTLLDRRKAFKKMGKWLLAGGGTLTVAWIALGREGPIDDWVAVGPITGIPINEIQSRVVTVTARGRWFDLHVDRLIWLQRHADDSVTVLSAICPHKDYTINWMANLGTFVCPGHKSAFDPSGKVLSGPAPRPMDALEHKVENGVLMVRYQKFKRSLPTKEIFT